MMEQTARLRWDAWDGWRKSVADTGTPNALRMETFLKTTKPGAALRAALLETKDENLYLVLAS